MLCFAGSAIDYDVTLVIGASLIFNQFLAIIKKKIIYFFRSWIVLLLQNIISVTFLIIGMMAVKSFRSQSALPPLDISLATYEKSYTVLERRINDTGNPLAGKIADEYRQIVESAPGASHLLLTDESVETFLMSLGRSMLFTVDSFYLTAASITNRLNDTDSILAWFNNQPLHTAPLTLNLVHNAMARAALGSDHSISVINNPLPFTAQTRRVMLAAEGSLGFQLATNLSFAMSFVAAFYVLFYIKVRR